MTDREEARRVLLIEARSIMDLAERLDENFDGAVKLIFETRGKVIVTGMGKSGQVARKIASTLSSTGTPALFLHPGDSAHGDLGVISEADVVVALSYGGETDELGPVLNYVQRRNIPLIAMTGAPASRLAQSAQVVLDVSVKEEACPFNLAPTASSTVMLALGDALAMATFRRRGLTQDDFAQYHPSGSLGRRLLTRVSDLMHIGDALPLVAPEEAMATVLSLMTKKEVRGVAGVVASDGALIGIITDGDVRRRLEQKMPALEERAGDLMARNPKTIDRSELAARALFLMEQFQIQTLFVVDRNSENPRRPIGLIHLQDLIRARIR